MTPHDAQDILSAISVLSLLIGFCLWVCVGMVLKTLINPILRRFFPDKPNRITYLKPNGDTEYLYWWMGRYVSLEQRNALRAARSKKGI